MHSISFSISHITSFVLCPPLPTSCSGFTVLGNNIALGKERKKHNYLGLALCSQKRFWICIRRVRITRPIKLQSEFNLAYSSNHHHAPFPSPQPALSLKLFPALQSYSCTSSLILVIAKRNKRLSNTPRTQDLL